MNPTVLASLRAVSVRRTGSLVLREVDLAIGAGTSLAVFGANGSGKTTLLRVLATLLAPSQGDGEVLGASLGGPAVEGVRGQIGLVGHEPALYPNLTLGENLELVARVLGRDPTAAVAALEQVGLGRAAARRAARSSNGMRRRAEFGRMLLVEPRLLLLDEAHVGLDPEAWRLVGHLVNDVTARGGGAVIVAHEKDRIRPLASRAVELAKGFLTEVAL